MQIQFKEIHALDVERLASWISDQTWPYHTPALADAAWVRERAAAGYFFGSDTRSFWALSDDPTPVGIVRVFDLADVTPLVDLRIASAARGHGVGTSVLRWVTRFVFETFPEKHRLGGYTRHDNLPMRRVFEKCNFIQEANHRRAWQVNAGTFADAIGYATLRADWATGTITTPLSP